MFLPEGWKTDGSHIRRVEDIWKSILRTQVDRHLFVESSSNLGQTYVRTYVVDQMSTLTDRQMCARF